MKKYIRREINEFLRRQNLPEYSKSEMDTSVVHIILKEISGKWARYRASAFSERFIREFSYTLDAEDWRYLGQNVCLSEGFMRDFHEKLSWKHISSQNLTLDFMREFREEIEWGYVTHRADLTENFVREMSDWVSWVTVSKSPKISEEFLREMSHFVNWGHVSGRGDLSEDFLREFQDKIIWRNVSFRDSDLLTEDFIREFVDRLNWHALSNHRKFIGGMSEEFVEEFSEYLVWEIISGNSALPKFVLEKYPDRLIWQEVCLNYLPLTSNFPKEFSEHIDWLGISCRNDLKYQFLKDFKSEVLWDSVVRTKSDWQYVLPQNETFHVVDENLIAEPEEIPMFGLKLTGE